MEVLYRDYKVTADANQIVTDQPNKWKVTIGIFSYGGSQVHIEELSCPFDTFDSQSGAEEYGITKAKSFIDSR